MIIQRNLRNIFGVIVSIGIVGSIISIIYFLSDTSEQIETRPCVLRKYLNGYVCVCNATYCDRLAEKRPNIGGDYILISSSESGARFQTTRGTFKLPSDAVQSERDFFDTFASPMQCNLQLNQLKTFQKIIGFGGAFTGAVSELLSAMPDALQRSLYQSYYSSDAGIGYTMMRIPIGGSDFDLRPWAYNESPLNDTDLSNFTRLDDRDLQKIRQIQTIVDVTKNANIKYLGAAWSPPKWMKSNNDWTGHSELLQPFYSTWANYHLKFLQYMAAANIRFWAISTGNEPLNGKFAAFFVHFMSLGWSAKEQGIWLNEHLGPTLAESNMRDVKLLIGDDQRYTLPWWPEEMKVATNKQVMKYVSGIGVHWYWDQFIPAAVLDRTHEMFPDQFILTTESSIGDKPGQTHGPILGSWSRAEQYATYMIQNLNHWSVGWIDWNLVLNEQGGPSYANNFVDAAVIVNSTTHDEIYKQPIFYVIGHFSKFILPECVRIDASVSCGSVLSVAFACPDHTITVILYNKANTATNLTYTDDRDASTVELHLLPKSINTFVYY